VGFLEEARPHFVRELRSQSPHELPLTDEAALSHPFPARSFHSREPKYRRNGKIRAREVRVLDESKQQLGVMSLTDALRLAQSKGLDLVEIAPNATPPVCRVVNYGKLMYEDAKSHKESRKAGSKMKEIQLSAGIDPHDFSVKLARAIEFLCDGMKVRVKLRFRGRQRVHKEVGFEVVNRFIKEAGAYGQADAPPKMLGERDLNVMLSPLPRNKRAPNPHEAETPKQPLLPEAPPHEPLDPPATT
jgi:translation initiation factor IF-3